MTDSATTSAMPAGTRKARTAARMADVERFRGPIEEAGAIAVFSARALRALPHAVRLYPAEVARQCGILIRSNALVVLFMLFMLGALMGITGAFFLEGIGLESYSGAIPSVPIMRGVVEIVFGWVLAAKFGCGTVAELGAMRISEETDAMDVMGVQSFLYLVCTRVAAAMLVLPALFVTALGVFFLSSKLFFVGMLQAVSGGGFDFILFLFQGPRDLLIALAWGAVLGLLVTLVSCYYGYNAQGGPVGVGRATAQSMLVNLVVISVLSFMFANLFYAGVLTEAFGT